MKLEEAVFYMMHKGQTYSVLFKKDRVRVRFGVESWTVDNSDGKLKPNATNAKLAIRIILNRSQGGAA